MLTTEELLQRFNTLVQESNELVQEYYNIQNEIRSKNLISVSLFSQKKYRHYYNMLREHSMKFNEKVRELDSVIESLKDTLMEHFVEQYLFVKSFREYMGKVNEAIYFHAEIQKELSESVNKINIKIPDEIKEKYHRLNVMIEECDSLGKKIIEQFAVSNGK